MSARIGAGQNPDQRWLKFRNDSGKRVPGYACMMLWGYGDPDRGNGFGWLKDDDGTAFVRIDQPNEAVFRDQNAAVLFINGPEGVEPKKFGSCTQDFPTMALHDGARDGLVPGGMCGPVPGEWYVFSGGTAFECQGHTMCDPPVSTWMPHHCVVISLGRENLRRGWRALRRQSLTTLEPNEYVRTTSGDIASQAIRIDGRETFRTYSRGITALAPSQSPYGGYGFRVQRNFAGLYLASFSATLYADSSVPRGTPLILGLEVWQPTTSVLTTAGVPASYELRDTIHMMREHQIESDIAYGITNVVAKENVATTVPFALNDFAVVGVRNLSTVPVILSHSAYTLTSLAGDTRPAMPDESSNNIVGGRVVP